MYFISPWQKVGSTVALLQRIWDWVSGKTEDFGQSFKYFPIFSFYCLCHKVIEGNSKYLSAKTRKIEDLWGDISIDSFLTLAVKLQNGGFLLLELQNRGLKIVGLIVSSEIEEILLNLLVLPNRWFM